MEEIKKGDTVWFTDTLFSRQLPIRGYVDSVDEAWITVVILTLYVRIDKQTGETEKINGWPCRYQFWRVGAGYADGQEHAKLLTWLGDSTSNLTLEQLRAIKALIDSK